MSNTGEFLIKPVSAALRKEWEEFIYHNFGITPGDDIFNKFCGFSKELADWNSRINLVSAGSIEDIFFRHFADSLSSNLLLSRYINKIHPGAHLHAVDIGSGAGFPGIPLKIANPELEIKLVESIKKKCGFMNHLIKYLGLSGIHVLNERAEVLARAKEHRSQYDIALIRALSSLSTCLELALPMLKTGGWVLLYKTEQSTKDLVSAENALSLLNGRLVDNVCYRLPGEERIFTILVYEKLSETPETYPRRAGIPQKRPL